MTAAHMPNPRDAWVRLVDAVIAFRQRRKADVVAHLRAVEAVSGRPTAERQRDMISACARAESWSKVEQWPAWDYKSAPPPPPPSPPPKKKKGR